MIMKVAVVGTGAIAPQHVEGLLTFPETCEIVALCDIYPEKAERMAARYGLHCAVYSDYKKMLSEMPEIDMIHVCTPPYTHAMIAIDVMNCGIHAVVEKPMAASLEECDAMLEAEKRNGVVLSSIAQNRFRNGVYKLKQLLDSGLAGHLCCAHVHSYWWRAHGYYDLWWRGLWEKEGGGPTLNHAVHHIDMLNWLTEKVPDEVAAILSNVMHDNSEVEDISLAVLQYDDGSVADIISSVIHHGEEQGIELQCSKAKLSFPWSVRASKERVNAFPEENQELVEEIETYYHNLKDLPYEGHTGQIHNILTALESGKRPFITGADGRRTIEMITAIYEAGAKKQMVQLPLNSGDPFYTFDGLVENAPHFNKKSACIENFQDSVITFGNDEAKIIR